MGKINGLESILTYGFVSESRDFEFLCHFIFVASFKHIQVSIS